MVDVYDAYGLLSWNHLLKHNFEFIEILVGNEKVFSNKVQTKFSNGLSSLAATVVENKIRQFAILQTDKCIFSVGEFPGNKFIVFETHPIDAAVNETEMVFWLYQLHALRYCNGSCEGFIIAM